jgi:hypothetical protein
MSPATAVAAVRQSFVVEWEEPAVTPDPVEGSGRAVDASVPAVDAAEDGSARALVSVTTTVVAAVTRRRPGVEQAQDEAEQLRLSWMQGEPTF